MGELLEDGVHGRLDGRNLLDVFSGSHFCVLVCVYIYSVKGITVVNVMLRYSCVRGEKMLGRGRGWSEEEVRKL